MIKLIAKDMDGTFLDSDKRFDPEFIDIFYKLKEKGIKLEMVRLAALQSMIMLLHVKNSTVMIIITALYYNQLILNIHPL